MMPLDQFKNMPKEPKLGEMNKIEHDSAPLKVPLADQKAQLMSELYGVKPKINLEENVSGINDQVEKPEQNISNKDEKSDGTEVDVEKIDGDSQYFPNLKSLYESGHIDSETFIKTAEALKEAKPDDEAAIFLKVINKLSDSNLRDSLIKGFENKQEINENNFEKTEFFKDSKGLNIDLDIGVGGLELMLARNYVSINNVDGTQDKTRDLSKSMDTSLNEILEKSGNDFKKINGELINKIKVEKSLDIKYSLLKKLYKEDLKRDAVLGGTKGKERLDKELDRKKTSLIEKAKDISEKIKEVQNIKDDKQKQQEIERLNLEKQKIIKEGKDIDGFEAEVQLLSGGKNDKGPEYKGKIDEN